MTLEQRLALAEANLGGSVVRVNPDAREEAGRKNAGAIPFGIKNTADIPAVLIDRLRHNPDFLWLTVDRMAPLGRSVDTGLVNPLTYRCMTGSSSGAAVNILHRINNVAIGTDGGGSVLAPALATNLFSFMGKGVGLTVAGQGKSTEGLAFVGGIGLLAATLPLLEKATGVLCGLQPDEHFAHTLHIPAPGSMPLPGSGGDCYAELAPLLKELDIPFRTLLLHDIYNREATVKQLEGLGGLLLTLEGPVDVYGYDETIPRAFGGNAPKHITGAPGKGLVKAANIAGWSALTVPSGRLATGFVIGCAPGEAAARQGFALARLLAARWETPEMFRRFFIEGVKFVEPSPYK